MADAPTVVDAVSFLTQAMLVLLAGLTLAEYVRKRNRQIAEIALMFGSLGVTSLVAWTSALITNLGYVPPAWLSLVSGVAFLANPYLIILIVKQFRTVPKWVEATALGGMLASWAYVVYATVTGLQFPAGPAEPSWRVILAAAFIVALLAYLVLAYAFAAYSFLTGAYRLAGVARHRLRFAAAATGLFALVFVLAGATFLVRDPLRATVTAGLGVLFLAAIGAFYLGFAAPRWLRRSWQLEELHAYVRATSGHDVDERAASATRQLQKAAIRLANARRASIVTLTPERWQGRVHHADGQLQEISGPMEKNGVLARARDTRRTILQRGLAPESDAAMRAGLKGGAAQNSVAIPLVSNGRVWRVLTFPLDRIPFFIDETIEILELLAGEAAAALELQAYAKEQEDLRLRDARVAADELRRQNVAFQEATRLKSEFLANMSHELRTPLNGIIGFADLMASGKVGEVSETHKEFLGDILTSARHLLQLINDVLDLAKVEAGRMDFRPEDVDPEAVVRETLAVLRPLAQKKKLATSITRDADVTSVRLDPVRLKQIVYNYVSNAIKFTPDGGRIDVTIRADGPERFRIDVTDTGVGIKPEDLAKLFHEFQQLDGGTAKHHQGTGLGLALVKRLAEAQGGTVGATSRHGEGSTFTVELPRHATLPAHDALATLTTFTTVAPHVLVVEDDAREREALVDALTAAGYLVDAAPSGRAALALIEARDYDAATIDLILPDAHGYDILHALRTRPGGDAVAVLIVTQLAADSVRTAFPIGGVFQKPMDPALLAEHLKRANVTPQAGRPILVVDDDATVRRVMEAHLRALGHGVILAKDGEEALAAAQRDTPALIVLDLVMPHMDGFAFLDAYRAREARTRDVPIIVWTSKDLTPEEHARLQGQVQLVAYKAEGGTFALVNRLESILQRRHAK